MRTLLTLFGLGCWVLGFLNWIASSRDEFNALYAMVFFLAGVISLCTATLLAGLRRIADNARPARAEDVV